MFRATCLSFFLAFLLFSPQGFSDPAAEVLLSKNKLKTGEIAELRIQLLWPKKEASYTFAVPELPLQNLSITNQAESQETFLKNTQEWTRKDFIFELSPKEAGAGEIGSFVIGYVNPASGAQGQIAVSELKVQITQAQKHRNFFPLLFVLAGVSAGTAFFLVLKIKKSRRKTSVIPAQTQAVLAIKGRIQTANLSTENAVPNLGRGFQEFLKEIYSVDASHKSEGELISELKRKNLPPDEIKFIEKILHHIREVKYTGQTLSESDFQFFKKEITAFIDSKQIHSFSSSN